MSECDFRESLQIYCTLIVLDATLALISHDLCLPCHLVTCYYAARYTEANLSFEGLKGRDAAVFALLSTCSSLDFFVTTVVKHEYGSASSGYDWHKRSRHCYDCYDEDSDSGGEAVMEVCACVAQASCFWCCC
jgi:hypothetical protein